jgi:hypothetical protein
MADHRTLKSSYELPDITDDPIELVVKVNDKTISCLWVGIQFTMPDESVTFTVLLVQEES